MKKKLILINLFYFNLFLKFQELLIKFYGNRMGFCLKWCIIIEKRGDNQKNDFLIVNSSENSFNVTEKTTDHQTDNETKATFPINNAPNVETKQTNQINIIWV